MGQDKCEEHKKNTTDLTIRLSVLEETMTLLRTQVGKTEDNVTKIFEGVDKLKDFVHKVNTKTIVIYSLVVLLVGFMQTIAVGILLNKITNQQNDVYREIRLTFDLLSKELENQIPYSFNNSYPDDDNECENNMGKENGNKNQSVSFVREC